MVLVASFGLLCVASCGPIDYHQHPHGDDDHDDDHDDHPQYHDPTDIDSHDNVLVMMTKRMNMIILVIVMFTITTMKTTMMK